MAAATLLLVAGLVIYTLYRIIRAPEVSSTDFRSRLAHCLSRRGAEVADPLIWAGVSTFQDAERAAQRARRYSIGTYLARLRLSDDDARVLIRPTLTVGHFTVCACESLLFAAVEDVEQIEQRP